MSRGGITPDFAFCDLHFLNILAEIDDSGKRMVDDVRISAVTA